ENQVVQNAVPNLGVQNVWNQNGLIVVLGIASQNETSNGNGNLVVARAEGDIDEIEKVNANCILMANLQQALSSASCVEHNGGTVKHHPAIVEETLAYFELLYNNLAIEVEKVNSVNRKMKEFNAELSTKLARYKNQEKLKGVINSLFIKNNVFLKKVNALHLSSGKQITTLNEEISNLSKHLSKEKSTVSSLQEEKKRLKSDFKMREDELLDKQIDPENKIKKLDNILIPQKADKTHDLSNLVTSNSVPTTKESKVIDYDTVIAPRMFRIDPRQTSRKDNFVPNKPSKASIRTNPITVSQPHVIIKKVVNADSNGFSSIGVDITTKTRRPEPRTIQRMIGSPFCSKIVGIMNK
ncbi:hypothetical protein Tco_1290130, partial [Tanacetum coccineum]